MNLADAPDQAEYRATLRSWLEANRDHAPRIEREPSEEQMDQWRAWSRLLFDSGYTGITWPDAYGGGGLAQSFQAIWFEEMARAGVPDHLGLIGLDMAGPTIIEWGSDEQKKRLLPAILRCDEIWCQGFSEPGSGSDLAAARTSAVLDGDSWVVNGQKTWSSFAHYADWCILVVRTDTEVPKHRGLSYLLVDMHSPGVEVRPVRQLTGDPEFNEIFFTDVRVPLGSMLGEPGDGWKVALTTLSHERGTYGVKLAAELDSTMRAAVALLSRPGPDGRRPADDPLVRDRLAELWIELQALRITNLRALSELVRSGVPGAEATISKLHWSELNQQLMQLVTESLGPAGLEVGEGAVDGGRWSYGRLRSRGNTIEAGTSEILRNIIAERVVGLPRSR
jgi:alkylation response protein AidB-like acyl-CoA dehydrogenase